MKCIVGLGNPGNRYSATRHNAGFQLIDFLIGSCSASPLEGTELYESFVGRLGDEETALMMPQTYMNNSGSAVREFIRVHGIRPEDVLIAYDDFQLPFGTLRMRPKGSDGGHNGMASVIYHLQSDLIPRLRIGVSGSGVPEHHTHELMSEYVLTPFDQTERKLLPDLYRHAGDACECWIRSGVTIAMNGYNKKFFSSAGAE